MGNEIIKVNWSIFFTIIGTIFALLWFFARMVGNFAGENSWGYIASHSYIVGGFVIVLFFIAMVNLFRDGKELKEEKESNSNGK